MADARYERFTVAQFIDAEISNLKGGTKNLERIDPDAMGTVELCADILHDVCSTFGTSSNYRKGSSHFADWATRHRVPPNEAANLLLQSTLLGESTNDCSAAAKEELERAMAVLVRGFLVLRFQRDFYLGIADVLKNRINAGLGSLRVQCETLALIRLCFDEPLVAFEWLDADIGKGGKEFYNKYHRRLVTTAKSWGFGHAYERASVSALHSRVGGVTGPIIATGSPSIVEGGIGLSMLTVDTLDTGEFYLVTCFILRFYERAFARVREVMPDINVDAALELKIQDYRRSVRARWGVLSRRYPKIVERARRSVRPI